MDSGQIQSSRAAVLHVLDISLQKSISFKWTDHGQNGADLDDKLMQIWFAHRWPGCLYKYKADCCKSNAQAILLNFSSFPYIQVYISAMPWREHISSDLSTVGAYLYEKGYEVISKQFGAHYSTMRNIIGKRQAFKTAVDFFPRVQAPAISPRGHTIDKNCKDKKNRSQSFISGTAGFSILKANVHDSTIGKRMNKYGLFGKAASLKSKIGKVLRGSCPAYLHLEPWYVLGFLQSCIFTHYKTSGLFP